MKLTKTTLIAALITLIVGGAGGFYGGTAYTQAKSPARGNFVQFGANGNRPTGGAANRLRQGVGMVTGEIISKDDKSVTVKDRNGGSKIIFFAPSTSIGKATEGTKDDLASGETIIATGTPNSDGTITAQNIQIRPKSNTDLDGHPYGNDEIRGGAPGFGGQRPQGGAQGAGGPQL